MGDQIRLLLLEDSQLDADLAGKYLKSAGVAFELTRVETREQFTDALGGKTFDMILADYSLPDFDGQQALEIAQKIARDVPFIFVSGTLGEEIAIDSLRCGATDYVLKKRLDRLAPAVTRALVESEDRRARREAEAALQRSELRYRLLVDNVHEYALFMTDIDGAITFWNAGAERLFGYREREALGRSLEELHIVDGEREEAITLEDPAAAMDGGRAHFEGWLIRRNGSPFWATGTKAPVKVTDNVQGFVIVIRDNTDRKQAEKERTALLVREEIARAEAKQRAELTETNAALARSNAELEQFAYAASHDLQEPIRMVKSFAQMLSQHWRGKLDPKAEDMLGVIESASSRMQSLVNDLLSYSRVLHDREQAKQCVDLNVVLDQACFCFTGQIEQVHAELVRDPLPVVLAHGERIGLVFQNLLSNALKYRRADPPRIYISAQRRQEEWVIAVQDNGIGFKPEYAERIFGLFKRLHRTDEYPGTGVGLALCRQIIEQHGGRIWAESALGVGATFYFSLPGAA